MTWTPKLDAVLRKRVEAGEKFAEIAAKVGKTREACKVHARRLGLTHPAGPGRPQTFSRQWALRLRKDGTSVREIARIVGVNKMSVYRAIWADTDHQ